MSNTLGLHSLTRNNTTDILLKPGVTPSTQFPNSRSPNHHHSTPYLNASLDQNQNSLNQKHMNYGYKRDQDYIFKPKERSQFGLYSRDGATQNARMKNLKSTLWEEERGISARGSPSQVHALPGIKAFLDKITLNPGYPGSDSSRMKKKENTHSQSGQQGGMMAGLWKDPKEERSKKSEMYNEWKQTLDGQIQARQAQKKHEAELKKIQDIAEEQRYQRHIGDIATQAYFEDSRPIRNLGGSDNALTRGVYSMSPSTNSTPKNQYTDDYIKQTPGGRDMYKPFKSSPNTAAFLNAKIDQLKTNILQSQKIFSDQMKGLQSITVKRHQMMVLEKEYHPAGGDALDEYMHQQDFQRELRGRISPKRLNSAQKIPNIFTPKHSLPDDMDIVLDDRSVGELRVEGQFVGITNQNPRLSRVQSQKVLSVQLDDSDRPVSVEQSKKAPVIEEKVLKNNFAMVEEAKEEPMAQKEEIKGAKSVPEEVKVEKVEENTITFELSPKNANVNKPKESGNDPVKNPKRSESVQKVRLDPLEKDNNNPFKQTSVFVNTANVDSMDEFKRYIKKEDTPTIPVEPKKTLNILSEVTTDEHTKRRLPSAAQTNIESIGDLTHKLEPKDQPKRREIKRFTGIDSLKKV